MQIFISKEILVECARNAEKWGYNRQLSNEVSELPDGKYPAVRSIEHSFKQGKPCKTHMRVAVELPKGVAVVDMPMEYYRQHIAEQPIEV